MGTGMHRLASAVWMVVGLALIAPIAVYALYRNAHPDADIRIELVVFAALIALFGLNMAVRALVHLIRGR